MVRTEAKHKRYYYKSTWSSAVPFMISRNGRESAIMPFGAKPNRSSDGSQTITSTDRVLPSVLERLCML
jgi:hypothetical protein